MWEKWTRPPKNQGQVAADSETVRACACGCVFFNNSVPVRRTACRMGQGGSAFFAQQQVVEICHFVSGEPVQKFDEHVPLLRFRISLQNRVPRTRLHISTCLPEISGSFGSKVMSG
jgi:hypothetical protein